MRIVQISDLNIGAKGDENPAAKKMAENLQLTIANVNQLTPKPDLVLINGNITNDGSPESAAHARELLDTFEMPYKLVCGPQDDRRTTLGVFEHACANEVGGVVSYMVEGFDLRIIGLDSLGHNGTGGHICQKRLNWVNERLAENQTKPTLIFMHHPPMKLGMQAADAEGFNNADVFGQLVQHYSHIKAIFSGHVNFASHTCWNETVVSTAPSMGMESALDTMETGEAVSGAPAYNIHHYTEFGDLVSRTVYLD